MPQMPLTQSSQGHLRHLGYSMDSQILKKSWKLRVIASKLDVVCCAVGSSCILLHLRLRGHGNPVKVWSVQATNYISSPTYNDIEWNPFEVDEAL